MYELLYIGASFAIINAIIGAPLIFNLIKKAHKEELNAFYRLNHSTNFNFNYDILQKIAESDKKTKKLFTEFKLYIYDKFNQNLDNIKTLIETDTEKALQEIEKMRKEYANDSEGDIKDI